MTFSEAVGKVILAYIGKKGIKSCAIAQYLNEREDVRFDSAKISLTLHGKREMSLSEYKHICDFLGVKYDKFLSQIKEAEV